MPDPFHSAAIEKILAELTQTTSKMQNLQDQLDTAKLNPALSAAMERLHAQARPLSEMVEAALVEPGLASSAAVERLHAQPAQMNSEMQDLLDASGLSTLKAEK